MKYGICEKCIVHMRFAESGLQEVEDIENKYFEQLYAATYYYELEKNIIYDLKYNQKPYLAKIIAPMIIEKLGEKDYDGIIAIPLSREKHKKREYNQSYEIAKYISYELKIPLIKNVLLRVKETKPQNNLNPLERIINLSDAFRVENKRRIEEKKLLLIDDIYTTGSTVDISSKELVMNGAKLVDIAVFSRAVYEGESD